MSLQGSWVVDGLAVGGELQPPLKGPALTLRVEGRAVSGSTGVNRFSGELDDANTLIGPMATTQLAGSHELMAQEEIYLRHLGEADSFETGQEGISLLSNGLITVTLKPAQPNPGTSAHGITF